MSGGKKWGYEFRTGRDGIRKVGGRSKIHNWKPTIFGSSSIFAAYTYPFRTSTFLAKVQRYTETFFFFIFLLQVQFCKDSAVTWI